MKLTVNAKAGERLGILALTIKAGVKQYKLSSIEAYKDKEILGLYNAHNVGSLENPYIGDFSFVARNPAGEVLIENISGSDLRMQNNNLLELNLGILGWDKSEIILTNTPTKDGQKLYLLVHYKK